MPNKFNACTRMAAFFALCPGTAALGISLQQATGLSLGITTLIVAIVVIGSCTVGIASAFAPHLAAILRARTSAAVVRAALEKKIDISDAKELLQADAAFGKDWSNLTKSTPSAERGTLGGPEGDGRGLLQRNAE